MFGQIAAIGVRHDECVSTRNGGCGWMCAREEVESGDVESEVEVERGND